MDVVSKDVRSRIMAQIRSFDNKTTENAFIEILKNNSIKGWRRNAQFFGKPDFVFPAYHVAIFIDGCFWHNCPKHCRLPASNTSYWQGKIVHNRRRDIKVNRELKKNGWVVMRFWEHDLRGGRSFTQKIGKLKKIVQQLQ